MSAEHSWVVQPMPRPEARLSLVCIPYAGGSVATFRNWAERLPDVELRLVQLPGRNPRHPRTGYETVEAIAARLADGLAAADSRPMALFGHSLGALIAFELARCLPVSALVVAGRRAPSVTEQRPPLSDLPQPAFVAEVQRRYGDGIPAAVLGDPDLSALLLPVLRADLALIERHVHAPGSPLSCPIWVYGGADDAIAPPAELAAWARETASTCTVRQFPGGHFFIQSARDAVLEALRADLATLDGPASVGANAAAPIGDLMPAWKPEAP